MNKTNSVTDDSIKAGRSLTILISAIDDGEQEEEQKMWDRLNPILESRGLKLTKATAYERKQ